MCLPVTLLWKAKIDLRRKIGIGALFSLTFFTIVVAIIRAAIVINASGQPDDSLIAFWSKLEHTVAIIIASSISFRAWFTRRNRPGRISDEAYERGCLRAPGDTGQDQALRTMKTVTTVQVHSGNSLDSGMRDGIVMSPSPPPKDYV